MNEVIRGSFELMKQLNISAVLKAVMSEGPISRADIAKRTGLTPASVTNITKVLIENGYLNQLGIGESSGGRPPIILEINPNARYIIGVSIGVGRIEAVISNIAAEIVYRKEIIIGKNQKDKEIVFPKLIKLINEVIDTSEITEEKIIGIGIAMHGIVNSDTGISEYSPFYKWTDVNIKSELSNEFSYPIFIDNDVRAMALAESHFGVSKGVSNFIIINVSNGIGAGIIINNAPYYGVSYSAGEIGHIFVDSNGDKCECGNYGCLETVASNSNIVKKTIKLLKQGSKSILQQSRADINDIDINDICLAANEQDSLAIEVLREASRYIGIAVANLVNILNPTDIVVVGEIFEQTSFAMDNLEYIVKSKSLKMPSEKVRIVKSKLSKDAAAIGAVTLVIQEIFKGDKLVLK